MPSVYAPLSCCRSLRLAAGAWTGVAHPALACPGRAAPSRRLLPLAAPPAGGGPAGRPRQAPGLSTDKQPRADRWSRESCSPPSMPSAGLAGQPFAGALRPLNTRLRGIRAVQPPRLRRKPGKRSIPPSAWGLVAAPAAPSRCACGLIQRLDSPVPSDRSRASRAAVPPCPPLLPHDGTLAFARGRESRVAAELLQNRRKRPVLAPEWQHAGCQLTDPWWRLGRFR